MREHIDPVLLSEISPRAGLTGRILDRLSQYELTRPGDGLHDEQVWTLLFAYGFVARGLQAGRSQLANLLVEGMVPASPFRVQLEMLPMPPRQGVNGASEGNSNIDLILGHVGTRGRTLAGVDYRRPDSGPGWVCMTEAKWLSDIAGKTTHDFHRNQLARVIETALAFQQPGDPPGWPDEVHVTLLTPARFKPAEGATTGSRLYFYKFNEYHHPGNGLQAGPILADIEGAGVPPRGNVGGWIYPELGRRIGALRLHWVTYERLLDGMPDSVFKRHLLDFLAVEPRDVLQI